MLNTNWMNNSIQLKYNTEDFHCPSCVQELLIPFNNNNAFFIITSDKLKTLLSY